MHRLVLRSYCSMPSRLESENRSCAANRSNSLGRELLEDAYNFRIAQPECVFDDTAVDDVADRDFGWLSIVSPQKIGHGNHGLRNVSGGSAHPDVIFDARYRIAGEWFDPRQRGKGSNWAQWRK
jgi:hypothetical protein